MQKVELMVMLYQVLYIHPIKQGLKHYKAAGNGRFIIRSLHTSNKTRIETETEV